MPRNRLPQTVRASAAASVVACTAGLVSHTDSAEAAPVWIDAPHMDGTYTSIYTDTIDGSVPPDYDFYPADFDQDGKVEFFFIYYWVEFLIHTRNGTTFPIYNNNLPNQNAFMLGAVTGSDSANTYISPTVFSSRNAVFDAAVDFDVPDEPSHIYRAGGGGLDEVGTSFSDRSFFGGVFEGGDGNLYAGYIELQMFNRDDPGEVSMTIYDAGYALIPEPSSLALLGLGGLLLARRRR